MSEDKVRVQTSDGDIVEVELDIAKQWGPIKNMYEIFGSIDTKDKPVALENINTENLQKVMEWAVHHKQDVASEDGTEQKKTIDITSWDQDYFKVKQEILFEIIMASNYLGMTALLDMACKTVANMIKDKTPEQVRETFNIPNDLPPFDPLQ